VSLILATRSGADGEGHATELVRRCVRYGASPRGLQSLVLAAKARALLAARPNVSFEDVRVMSAPSLRHRLILNLEADAEGVSTEEVLADVMQRVPEVP